MQKEIDRFNLAFVHLATAYVERTECNVREESRLVFSEGKVKIKTARKTERSWPIPLTDQVRIADCLAVTVGRIEDRLAQRPLEDGADAEPVTLGSGVSFRLEKTPVSTPCDMPDGMEMTLEDMIRKIVAEMFTDWQKVNAACCINISREEAAEIEKAMQDAGPGKIEILEPGHKDKGKRYFIIPTEGKSVVVKPKAEEILLENKGDTEKLIACIEDAAAVWPDTPQEEN